MSAYREPGGAQQHDGWMLAAAFGLASKGELVALVGGGGKSSLLMALAEAAPGTVLLSTTTHLFAAQAASFAPLQVQLETDSDPLPADFWPALVRHGRGIVTGPPAGDKVSGVPAHLPGTWLARREVDWLLVEADGSRQLPVKAPAGHEPAVPPETSLLIGVMGIDALAGPIGQVAHRPERVCQLLGRSPVEWLTPADAARLMTHPQGGWQGRPPGCRAVLFINKVETAAQRQQARQIAQIALQNPGLDRVVIGSLRPEERRMTKDKGQTTKDEGGTTSAEGAAEASEPTSSVEVWRQVTAVILAAGQSKRMGQTKQLLPWGQTTVLGQTIANVQAAGVPDIVVVTGHDAAKITTVAQAAQVRTVYNPDYATGEMLSSLKAAVRALVGQTAAVLIFLADQPMLGPELIEPVLAAYREAERGLIVPVFGGRRGHPTLIDQAYFAELLALPEEAAPRDLLRRHEGEIHFVPVSGDAILRDLDVPPDYQKYRA
jgi:molybdenum cofactor cytidylyltransferase